MGTMPVSQQGSQQGDKGHQVIAPAAPDQEHEYQAQQRKQDRLVSGHRSQTPSK
jgi:hypothetical protein